jgi:pimeloyl-ACP methyl ester carboxylesterase
VIYSIKALTMIQSMQPLRINPKMKTLFISFIIVCAYVQTTMAEPALAEPPPPPALPALPVLPAQFDSLGPTVQSLILPNGREVHYIDDGEPGWLPVVFTGGLGTSVRVIRLLDFLKSMRHQLNIRIITVERNGYGQTEYDNSLGMADYAIEVEAVLELLGIEKFAVFGISGGGPYTAKIAARNADRLLSIHMAATSPALNSGKRCENDSPANIYRDMLRYPMQFFGFPEHSPMHQVEGFQDTAYDEAARAHNIRGQSADPIPLAHEIGLYCKEGAVDSSKVKVPVYVYRGLADEVLGAGDPDLWQQSYPNARVSFRGYPGEGHDVQYRHLDQILLDIAGFGGEILVCKGNTHEMVTPEKLQLELKNGAALGLCSWPKH